MLPVVLFLIANNWYAKNVVHDKVSETYRNTLDIFIGQLDLYMDEINEYLYKLAVLDADVGLLSAFPVDSDNYVLTKVRVQNKINRDVGFYNLLHTVFIYSDQDIIFSSSGNYGQVKQLLAQEAPRIAAQHRQMLDGSWMLWKNDLMPGRDFLVRLTPSENNQYIGAIISISDILELLRIQWDDDKIGESAVYSREGVRTADPLSFTDRTLPMSNLPLLDTPYQIIGQGESRQLVMIRASSMADIAVAVAVPEKQMLQGLPYFQKAVYFIALGLVFLFSMYLLFIQRTVFQPLHQLINGMKKLSLGMLDFRLQTTNTVEFQFMANTFNNMAEQISNLRIGMYEEQLRAQKNEMKQLQAQINPHFYMNSLNIIYNFARFEGSRFGEEDGAAHGRLFPLHHAGEPGIDHAGGRAEAYRKLCRNPEVPFSRQAGVQRRRSRTFAGRHAAGADAAAVRRKRDHSRLHQPPGEIHHPDPRRDRRRGGRGQTRHRHPR